MFLRVFEGGSFTLCGDSTDLQILAEGVHRTKPFSDLGGEVADKSAALDLELRKAVKQLVILE